MGTPHRTQAGDPSSAWLRCSVPGPRVMGGFSRDGWGRAGSGGAVCRVRRHTVDGSVYLSFLHHILCFPAQGGGLVGGQVAELGCHGLHPQQLRGPCGLHPGRRVSRGGKGMETNPNSTCLRPRCPCEPRQCHGAGRGFHGPIGGAFVALSPSLWQVVLREDRAQRCGAAAPVPRQLQGHLPHSGE